MRFRQRAVLALLTRRQGPLVSAFWATMGCLFFAALTGIARHVTRLGIHPFEVTFFRTSSALVVLLPVVAWQGLDILRSDQLRLYGFRVLVGYSSMLCWFYALSLAPLAQVTAIGFLAPLFGTLGAVLFLGERVRIRRVSALMVGFLGALVILRPGSGGFGAGQISAVYAAMAAGISAVFIKQLTTGDGPLRITALSTLLMVPMSLPAAAMTWTTPPLELYPWFLALGFVAVGGQLCMVRSFAAADASLAMTFEFSKLPFAVAIGYVYFSETVEVWTWVGALLIFGSAAYITRREALLRRPRPPLERVVRR